MRYRLAHTWFGSILGLMLVLSGCGGSNDTAAVTEEQTTPPPPEPTSTRVPEATATEPPPTRTPTVAPTATALPPTHTPTVAPSPTTGTDSSLPASDPVSTFRTIPTSDGFVAVRERPTTASSEITRLSPGTAVSCTGFVAGESLLFDGQRTDQWAECPSVGGYIFGLLLVAGDTPMAPPQDNADVAPGSDINAIVTAVRAHVGTLSFNYSVEKICMDRNFATASVVPEAGAADPVRAILERIDGSWSVIHFQPGMPILGAEDRRQLGIPNDFACLGEPLIP